MDTANDQPGLGTLARRLGKTALGALENRGELFTVELQEERIRLTEIVTFTIGLLFLGVLAILLLTATIIFLFPENLRLYAAAGFTIFYFAGAIAVFFCLKTRLKKEPFAETLRQFRKDVALLDSFHE